MVLLKLPYKTWYNDDSWLTAENSWHVVEEKYILLLNGSSCTQIVFIGITRTQSAVRTTKHINNNTINKAIIIEYQ